MDVIAQSPTWEEAVIGSVVIIIVGLVVIAVIWQAGAFLRARSGRSSDDE